MTEEHLLRFPPWGWVGLGGDNWIQGRCYRPLVQALSGATVEADAGSLLKQNSPALIPQDTVDGPAALTFL